MPVITSADFREKLEKEVSRKNTIQRKASALQLTCHDVIKLERLFEICEKATAEKETGLPLYMSIF